MDFFWFIPLLLVLALLIVLFFRRGTKQSPAGQSRLDSAMNSENRGEDLRE
jgi:hypothetical protein